MKLIKKTDLKKRPELTYQTCDPGYKIKIILWKKKLKQITNSNPQHWTI
jgi:hypothetical protein